MNTILPIYEPDTEERMAANFDSRVIELPQAGHFCQEDAPETLVALIQQFIQHTS